MAGRVRDVVVVGGGHNGLVAAAYLAKAGLDVLVLERRDVLGGAAVTEELWPGYRVSTAAYLISLLQEKVVRDLDLPRHGYEVLPKDPPYFSPRLDGQHFFMWRDMGKTLDELARLSKKDAERYPAYEEMLDRVADFVEPLLLEPPPALPATDPEALADWARFMGRVNDLPRQTLAEVMRIFTASVADLLDDWFESEALKSALATDGVIGAAAGPRTPGTAYVLLHHQMGRAAGSRGLWGFARGGTGAVSLAIAAAAREAGAEIRTGAAVEHVLVRDGRARGVVLAGGEEIAARIVVSNADPKRTFLGLVGREHLPDDLGAEVDAWKIEGVSFKLNLALGELPSWKALPGTALGPQHKGTMHVAPSIDYIERAWDDAKYGRTSAEPMIEVGIPTTYDPSLAPRGQADRLAVRPVRAVPSARGLLGDGAAALHRPRHRHPRRVRPEPPGRDRAHDRTGPAGPGSPLRPDRRPHLPRRALARPAVLRSAAGRLVALRHADRRALPVRLRNPPGRRRHGRLRPQRRPAPC